MKKLFFILVILTVLTVLTVITFDESLPSGSWAVVFSAWGGGVFYIYLMFDHLFHGQERAVERAATDELYRRQFESKVAAEVARRELLMYGGGMGCGFPAELAGIGNPGDPDHPDFVGPPRPTGE